jgi:flagellar basal-body rod modification protein FlgD
MSTTVGSIANSNLLSSYITQSQAGTTAAEQSMANNVANGVNAAASSTTTGNFNTFLKILTTQLQNQDPTAPMDSNQFTQELVEFSGVEQQLNTNNLLQQLVNLNGGATGVKSLLGYVGSYVEAPATNNQILIQNSQANFSYTLPSAAQSVTLTIKNSAGNTVASMSGPTASGANTVVWNGQDSSGNQLSDGLYTLSVAATDTSGNALTATNYQIIGQVTGVQSADSSGNDLMIGPYLKIDDANVDAVFPSSSIPSASSASNSSASSSSGSSGTSS